jgi:hypothetical protein
MALSIGTRLGIYEITGPLGAGGQVRGDHLYPAGSTPRWAGGSRCI